MPPIPDIYARETSRDNTPGTKGFNDTASLEQGGVPQWSRIPRGMDPPLAYEVLITQATVTASPPGEVEREIEVEKLLSDVRIRQYVDYQVTHPVIVRGLQTKFARPKNEVVIRSHTDLDKYWEFKKREEVRDRYEKVLFELAAGESPPYIPNPEELYWFRKLGLKGYWDLGKE